MRHTMSATDDEADSDNERETISFRIDKDVKKTIHHEAIELDMNLSTFARELLLDAWTQYVNEEGLKHRGE